MAPRLLIALALVLGGCAGSPARESTSADPLRDAVPIVPPQVREDAPPEQGPAGKIDTPTREAVPIAGSTLLRGRSTVRVDAPIARVRAAVLDFDRYAEFMPHYKASRTLASQPDGTRELYMQIAALHGALKMWARVAMPPPRLEGDTEIHQSRFLDGNVRAFDATWRLRALDERRTELSLEVFLHPRLPMPESLLNEENLDGAVKGVGAMRDRITASP